MIFALFIQQPITKRIAKWYFFWLIIGCIGGTAWHFLGDMFAVVFYLVIGTVTYPKILNRISKKLYDLAYT